MRRLVVRPGAIGDAIVSLPAVAHLQPAEIWCPAQNTAIFSHLAPARSLVAEGLDSLTLSPRTLSRLSEFDEIWSWYGAAREDLRAQLSHLNVRFLLALPPAHTGLHAADFYLSQMGAPLGAVPRIPASQPSQGYAVIHPFSGSPRKNWPLERFREVAAALAPEMPVHFCAGPEEGLAAAVRFPTLDELIPWLAAACVYIGNDSGISHLAAACGLPVVALFGPTDPRVWAPRGNVRILPFESTPAEVATAARSLRRSESCPAAGRRPAP